MAEWNLLLAAALVFPPAAHPGAIAPDYRNAIAGENSKAMAGRSLLHAAALVFHQQRAPEQ